MYAPEILQQQRNSSLVQHRTVFFDYASQKFKLASSHQVFSILVLSKVEDKLLKEGIQEQVLGYVLCLTFLKHS